MLAQRRRRSQEGQTCFLVALVAVLSDGGFVAMLSWPMGRGSFRLEPAPVPELPAPVSIGTVGELAEAMGTWENQILGFSSHLAEGR